MRRRWQRQLSAQIPRRYVSVSDFMLLLFSRRIDMDIVVLLFGVYAGTATVVVLIMAVAVYLLYSRAPSFYPPITRLCALFRCTYAMVDSLKSAICIVLVNNHFNRLHIISILYVCMNYEVHISDIHRMGVSARARWSHRVCVCVCRRGDPKPANRNGNMRWPIRASRPHLPFYICVYV